MSGPELIAWVARATLPVISTWSDQSLIDMGWYDSPSRKELYTQTSAGIWIPKTDGAGRRNVVEQNSAAISAQVVDIRTGAGVLPNISRIMQLQGILGADISDIDVQLSYLHKGPSVPLIIAGGAGLGAAVTLIDASVEITAGRAALGDQFYLEKVIISVNSSTANAGGVLRFYRNTAGTEIFEVACCAHFGGRELNCMCDLGEVIGAGTIGDIDAIVDVAFITNFANDNVIYITPYYRVLTP